MTVDVEALRHALLELHKVVLGAQQARYEREHGRIESRGALLQLVVGHADFRWLRALSALIAQLDEWIESDAAGEEELQALVRALRSLIRPDGTDAEFTGRYWPLLELEPEALVAHVRLWRLLGNGR